MEAGFIKATSDNLPKLDLFTLGAFLGANKDFYLSDFRNLKTSMSSRASYGDDAISFVQIKREENLCILKGKVCPEHKEHTQLYAVTLVIDEIEETIKSLQCHDCVGGCVHAVAFLMWVHRRSEEPYFSSVECYWSKSKSSSDESSFKVITAKELSNGKASLPSDNSVFEQFLQECKRRKIKTKFDDI